VNPEKDGKGGVFLLSMRTLTAMVVEDEGRRPKKGKQGGG